MRDSHRTERRPPVLGGSSRPTNAPCSDPTSSGDLPLPSLDTDVVAQLQDLGSDEFGALVRMFLEEATTRVAGMRAALGRSDAGSLQGIAHSLRGSSLAFGATRLAALCTEIEAAAPRQEASSVATLVAEMAIEFDRVRLALAGSLR